MSTESHTTSKTNSEHGATGSYIIGYILSLIFTLIPYFMVVNKYLEGTALLVTILSIAVLQMIIQLVFFLHLGRGPKPFYNIVFFFATAGVIVITIGASLFIMNNLYRNMSPEEVTQRQAQREGISQVGGKETGACKENKDNHVLIISDGVVSPAFVQAYLCDTLTFINEDALAREIVFGTYPTRESYGGEFEIVLDDARPETITLNQAGDFTFYDYFDPSVVGYFSVAPR